MKHYLWKFHWDCGRSGDLNGLFVATEKEVNDLLGKHCNFGEVLGKHSEIYGEIEEGEIKKVDLDSETVEKVVKVLGHTWSGYNPMHYRRYECPKCGEIVRYDEFHIEQNICGYCVEELEEKGDVK
jgi:hypothetical protein